MAVTKDTGFPVSTFSTADGTSSLAWTAFTTPGTNRILVAMLSGDGAGANAVNSLTSPNLTWTNRLSVIDAANNWRVEIWTAFASSVVTNEVITSTHIVSGVAYTRRSAIVFSCDGSGASGVGNIASNNNASGDPTLAVTATAAGSLVFVGFPYRSSGGDTGVDGNTTSEYDQGSGGGFGFNQRAGSRASTGTGSLTLGWIGDDPFAFKSIGGIEIKAASSAAALIGTSNASIMVAAALDTQITFQATSAFSGTIAAALTTQIAFVGSASAIGILAADLLTSSALVGILTTSATLSAALTSQIALRAVISLNGILDAGLTTQIAFSGGLLGSVVVTGGLGNNILLIDAVIQGSCFSTGDLLTAIRLQANTSGSIFVLLGDLVFIGTPGLSKAQLAFPDVRNAQLSLPEVIKEQLIVT
jgi:hypothetical protein